MAAAKKQPTKRQSGVSVQQLQDLALDVAVLEQQSESISSRFESVSVKFDRILEKMEQLALSTGTLITRHDAQIISLQQQLKSTEDTLRETRQEISAMVDTVVSKVAEQFTTFATEVKEQNKSFDERLTNLERWRWLLMGGGLTAGTMLGWILSNAGDLVKAINVVTK